MLQSPRILRSITVKLALKIRQELKHLSVKAQDSVLRDSTEAVKCFHWETVRLELVQNAPTLMNILSQLVGQSRKCPIKCDKLTTCRFVTHGCTHGYSHTHCAKKHVIL